jgi:rare lipoprotein A (peptidoglycan hydrolase)
LKEENMIRTHFYHPVRVRLLAATLFVVVAGLSHTAHARHKHSRKSNDGPRQEYPRQEYQGSTVGQASWYGRDFHGRRTASGETYNMNAYTCAHPSLPFGTTLRVTNIANGQSVIVKVNDRGPFAHGRIVDLSYGAAKKIGLNVSGVARVCLEPVDESLYLLELAQEEFSPQDDSKDDRDRLAALIKEEPKAEPTFFEVGYASLFGKRAPSGVAVNMDELVASHDSLPLGTMARVTNIENGKSVIVKINHRCNRVFGRVLQLTRGAAEKIDMTPKLVAKVKIEVIQ